MQLYSPWEFVLTDDEMKKVGELMLTWSHTEQVVAYCLKTARGLSEEEAMREVYPLKMDRRIHELTKLRPKMNADAQAALDAFKDVWKYLQGIRNCVAHGILINDTKDGTLFHLRSKLRTFKKDDVFACEELTLYSANVVMSLRYALGVGGSEHHRRPLPVGVPRIPSALKAYIDGGAPASV
jgi:hypothetical protein